MCPLFVGLLHKHGKSNILGSGNTLAPKGKTILNIDAETIMKSTHFVQTFNKM
jgi:hypothetical protein